MDTHIVQRDDDAALAPWKLALHDALRAIGIGIGMIAYVPDEGTGSLIPRLEADPAFQVTSVTREEEGVGILTGARLGGTRGVLLIQASGVGNSLNALASVNVACKIPVLLVIGERGGLGEFNPCQVPGGRATRAMLEAIGIQCFRVDSAAAMRSTMEGAATLCFSGQLPVAVILGNMMQKEQEA
ncbi:phosphonopyruvate decarboxylase [Falsiroseomonas sp. HW251]|uniref:phosphonopyruvate decarboxylase n=1 Tax=Falsiroseomonas sp. HW251 TaxID=3390998 RepID=UPI003D320B7F